MILEPPPHLPAPIRTDTSNAFAHDTMNRRVPDIARDVLKRNPGMPQALRSNIASLLAAVEGGQTLPAPNWPTSDQPTWEDAFRPHMGEGWHSTVWFFAETYFYRQLMAAVRWWETRRDPFLPNKEEDYSSDTHWELLQTALEQYHAEDQTESRLAAALTGALWGNRIDLSFVASRTRGMNAARDDLIVDDIHAVVEHTLAADTDTTLLSVHIIADNAGTELSMDMLLAHALLEAGNYQVVLHLKSHPTFVSDVTVPDIWHWFDRMAAQGDRFASFGAELNSAFNNGRLSFRSHPFWNSSRFLWDIPAHLLAAFDGAALVVIKGDANYRRLVGDALWPADAPFDSVTGYFPYPLLALRTLKSDPIVGLPTGKAEALNAADAAWRVNGQRGVAQFKQQAFTQENDDS
ncbi:MAG: damage-control phosphatase ARMT1 family protein [Chloroflexota bacterium]